MVVAFVRIVWKGSGRVVRIYLCPRVTMGRRLGEGFEGFEDEGELTREVIHGFD